MRTDDTAVIIGGGVGGLATANLLAKAGYLVDVFESRNQLGGRMGLLETDGFRFDMGPSWYLMPEVFENYYKLLNTSTAEQLKLKRLSPAYKVFIEGDSHPLTIRGNEKEDTELFERREAGAGKKLKDYLDNAEKIHKLALDNFLYTTFKSPTQIIKPSLLRYGPSMLKNARRPLHSLTSNYFSDPALQQILEYPAVFLGSSPFKAPALYSLMSYLDFRQGVFYPSGGMYAITESLVRIGKQLGVNYHLNAPVQAIKINEGQATGIELKNSSFVPAATVISNADLHFTQTKLLPLKAQDYPSSYWQKRQPGPSAMLVYLGIKGKLPELEHHNLFFVKAWKGNFQTISEAKDWPLPASMYVCKPSQNDNSVAPKGHENVFVLVPLPAEPKLHNKQLEKYAEKYIEQIAAAIGVDDLNKRIISKTLFGPQDFAREFNAWQGTALGLAHELRQSAFWRPKTQSKKVKNLYFVGANSQPGIGVPMCIIGAELVYRQIVEQFGRADFQQENV